ncbi:MAG TPA: hypothetical protein VEA78_12355, partial [Acidimicrobiales bacterium]|nr:hypothetical protein [Acidimicrobiales bacterium]
SSSVRSVLDVLTDVDDALRAAGLPFAFGGAIALGYATADPRGTVDLDINVFVDVDQAAHVLRSLPAGAAWDDDDVRLLARDGQVRVHVDDVAVDLFLNTDRFHEEAARRARHVPFRERTIAVLDPDDLAVFKTFFDRPKDWVDLESMVAAGSIHGTPVLRTLTQLLGDDDERVQRFRRLVETGSAF